LVRFADGGPLVKTCPHCSADNEPQFHFCDRCGESFLERRSPAVWPRYEALERVSNGVRFLSRLAGLAGLSGAIGALFYFWPQSFLVAVFFAGGVALAGYFALVVFRSMAELIRLILDVEDHLRVLRGRANASAKPAPDRIS
jgi:hypothetical protein